MLALAATTKSVGQFFNASHVPTESKVILEQLYPKVKHVTWTKEETGFEAGFVKGKTLHFVLFDLQGNYLGQFSSIRAKALPKLARQHLRETYASFEVEMAMIVETNTGQTRYDVQIGRGDEQYKLLFTEAGYVLEVMPLAVALSE